MANPIPEGFHSMPTINIQAAVKKLEMSKTKTLFKVA